MILHEILNFLVMVIPPPATLVVIVLLREGAKKAAPPRSKQPGYLIKTRGFPPPPIDRFGFVLGFYGNPILKRLSSIFI